MRLALISDIHGNKVALEAVLKTISTRHITQVVCLGDVASTGPQPCEVIKRLREVGCPIVMGNMDAWLLQPSQNMPLSSATRPLCKWNCIGSPLTSGLSFRR